MKIRSETYQRASLLTPYVVGLLLYLVSNSLDPTTYPDTGFAPVDFTYNIFSISSMLAAVLYFVGALYWLIPYSFLAVVLFLWSRNKDKRQIFKVFKWAPFYLSLLILVFSSVAALLGVWPDLFSFDGLLPMFVCAFPMTLLFGYIFIGLVVWLYDFLKSWGVMTDDDAITSITIER